jgi:transglutaminase-like putative cysteine protease
MRYPVYEAEPGVIDVYSDDQASLFSQLNSVKPNWRMYLQIAEGAEGTGPWRGPPIDERTRADEPEVTAQPPSPKRSRRSPN